jgi:lysine 2,3-aminomutase
MTDLHELDKIAISFKSRKPLNRLLKENPALEKIMVHSNNETGALVGVKNWVLEILSDCPQK